MSSFSFRKKLPGPDSLAGRWTRHFCTGLLLYCMTSLVVVLGVTFAQSYVKPYSSAGLSDFVGSFSKWDGEWYKQIADDGYSFDRQKRSNIAFFPAFPLTGREIAWITGWRTDLALVLVAHLALALTFVVFAAYVHLRCASGPPALGVLILLAFGLWPTTFFFRMAYTESMFLLVAVLVLFGLERRWPLFGLAILVGAATAMRPVGVALLPPLVLAAWGRSASKAEFALKVPMVLAVGCWGLALFMTYQAATFGDGLAFVQAQRHWRFRKPLPVVERAKALATLEPFVAVFDPASHCYWPNKFHDPSPFFSLRLANPIYFALSVVLIGVGAWRNWLSRFELLLAGGLLFIPYVTRAHEMCMCSMGRFAAVAFPIYVVVGNLLFRLPQCVTIAFLVLCGLLMGGYAALFAAGYAFF